MEEFEYEELVEATQSFSPSRLIGKGSHGSVFKGILKNNKLVAVKKPLHDHGHGHDHLEALSDNSKLDNEIRVLSSLRENPFVIGLVGTCHDTNNEDKKLLVMELMPNGSLHDLLHAHPADEYSLPSWPKRVEMAIQIARAVHFLHQQRPMVIHRDIKSANVLFDSNWDAKLADFGLAVLMPSSQVSQPAGTIGYLDPCYTTPNKLSSKNDVFSFGVVLLEIISGRKAMDMCRTPTSISEWAVGLIKQGRIEDVCDLRVPVADYMVNAIKHMVFVALSCVSMNEACRPTMGEIVLGMENCFRERIRIVPIWTSLLRRVMLARRHRKLAKKWRQKCDQNVQILQGEVATCSGCSGSDQRDHQQHHTSSSNWKMVIREVILAD
ncbi:hypothetical protein FNV43_RR03052 [Rhamnella rubrinervis]|uniref:non-specific serine/threonine protein kinase n=1 Tax=Rhamnella rubrinervis TaxID=2594499 RepID=A0A8K0HI51_9ROSA|nr:hypothetical protein FNV43_RR03052 [Rhamnella rubrinervis]